MKCTCDILADDTKECSPTCIGALWIFENIEPEELEALTNRAERCHFSADERIFLQGEPANQMFLIKAGRVKLGKVTEEGNEITLDIRQAGDFLGENTLNEDIDFPVTAICMEDTHTCGFSKSGFEKLVLDYPNIGLQVIRNLSKRIDWLSSRVGGMSYSHIEDRLYQALLTVAREHGSKSGFGFALPMPFTHEELAFLVGAHRVSITRAMKDLKQAGRIIQEGKMLIISAGEPAWTMCIWEVDSLFDPSTPIRGTGQKESEATFRPCPQQCRPRALQAGAGYRYTQEASPSETFRQIVAKATDTLPA